MYLAGGAGASPIRVQICSSPPQPPPPKFVLPLPTPLATENLAGIGRAGNRHRRTQSSPLNLPVDIPEVSSGDEVGSPATQAREQDKLIQDVSPSPFPPAPFQHHHFLAIPYCTDAMSW